MRIFHALVFFIFLVSCGDAGTGKARTSPADSAGSSAKGTDAPDPSKISQDRVNVKSEPVATYSKKIDNPLNNWQFKVQLFETPQTFKFLMKMEFEEMNEKDTLKIPNLGYEPKLEIRKGEEDYSCIIGFIDNKNEFREYKKVIAKDNTLKVTTLKHYGVYYK